MLLLFRRLLRVSFLASLCLFAIASSSLALNADWRQYQSLGEQAYSDGRLGQAEQLFQQAVQSAESSRSSNKDLSSCLNGLAGVYCEQARPDEAIQLYKRSLRLLQHSYGNSSPDLVVTLLALGSVYESQGDHPSAMKFYNRVFAINKATFGVDHLEVAKSLRRIAIVQTKQNKDVDAEASFKQALAILERHADGQTERLNCLEDYARLLRKQDRIAEAEQVERQMQLLNSKNLPEVNPSPALAQSSWKAQMNLISTAGKLIQKNESESVLRKVQESTATNTQLSNNYSTLANVYYQQGRYQEAEPLYKKMIAIDETTLGADHPGLADDLNNLALLNIAQQRYTDAEPLLKRALSIYQKAYGPDNLLAVKCQANLASVYEHLNNNTQAESLYKSALSVSQSSLGPNDAETAQLLNDLAFLAFKQGRYNDASTFYKWAIASAEGAYGSNSPLLAACLKDYALALRKLNEIAQAEQIEERAQAILTKDSTH